MSLRSLFLKALIAEMAQGRRENLIFDSLYFGGGTPSVFEAHQVDQIIQAADRHFKISADTECTLEVNPGTVTQKKFGQYFEVGINRVNIGVQSFQDANLNFLGRIHSSQEANLCFEWARRAGFDNIGIDLIYGLPQQTKSNWLKDLSHAVDLRPDHLSCYLLTCEPGTPLYQDIQNRRYELPGDESVRNLFDATIEYLANCGYAQYEISNFARKDDELSVPKMSRHNLKYWSFAPYLGLGPSAHSFIAPKRYWNYADVIKYIDEIEAGRQPIEASEMLSTEQLIMEFLYLGLRTIQGVDLAEFKQNFNLDFLRIFDKTIKDLEKDAFLKITESHCALTRKGLAFHESIAAFLTSLDFNSLG